MKCCNRPQKTKNKKNYKWTIKNFRKLPLRYIKVQEADDLQMKLFNKNDKPPRVTIIKRQLQRALDIKNFIGETSFSHENVMKC